MAERPIFISDINRKDFVGEKIIEFEWFPGFSVNQKQRSIQSLHKNFLEEYPTFKVLEVSSKSENELGVLLSAFNLMIKTKKDTEFSVETAFQASKVFDYGGPYMDLYNKNSLDAKRDPRIKSSGQLLFFQFFGRKWELEPKTLFYDWLYINALSLNKELSDQVFEYNAFTDIEFNPKKSINCQARSVALYVTLNRLGLLKKALSSVEDYKEVIVGEVDLTKMEVKEEKIQIEQLNIFDEIIGGGR